MCQAANAVQVGVKNQPHGMQTHLLSWIWSQLWPCLTMCYSSYIWVWIWNFLCPSWTRHMSGSSLVVSASVCPSLLLSIQHGLGVASGPRCLPEQFCPHVLIIIHAHVQEKDYHVWRGGGGPLPPTLVVMCESQSK